MAAPFPGWSASLYEGLGVLAQTATAHVSADLSKLARDPDVLIRWIWCPAIGEMAVLVPMGPDHWGPDSEEWVFHVTYQGEGPRNLTDEQIEANMRLALGIPDLPITIHKITRWALEGVLASTFRAGRVFLVGDAAHRHPPTGGLGLTSGIQDSHNLCWKLAAVLKGQAGETLLDTYEAERRPVDARNIQRSLENTMAHLEAGRAFGLSRERVAGGQLGPAQADPERQAGGCGASARSPARHPAPEHGSQRAERRIRLPLSAPRRSSRTVHRSRWPIDDIRLYEPSTYPGSPLPHAWIDDEAGHRRAMKDLVRPGRFLLIAGEEGQDWCAAAATLAEENDLPIDAVRIGHIDGDLFDPRLAWTQFRGISAKGAVLVRPDRVVCWRHAGPSEDPVAALGDALGTVLGRRLRLH